MLAPELVGGGVGQHGVDVVAAQPGVAGRGDHGEAGAADVDDREVEGAAAEIVDADQPGEPRDVAVGQRGGVGLGDQPDHVEPGHHDRAVGTEHEVGRLRIVDDVGFRGRRGIAAAERIAAHEHDAGEVRGEAWLGLQRASDVGERSERHQRDLTR